MGLAAAGCTMLALAGAGLTTAAPASAASPSFDGSTPQVFVAQGNPNTQLDQAVETNGQLVFHDVGSPAAFTYNAIGFDPDNDYIYGVATPFQAGVAQPNAGEIYQIGSDGVPTDTGVNAGPAVSWNVGAWDPDNGQMYFANGTTAAMTVYNPANNALSSLALNAPIGAADLSYADGYFWGNPSGTEIVRVDPSGGEVTDFTVSSDVFPEGAASGAAWTYGNGNLGFANNGNGGEMYQISVADAGSTSPTFALVAMQPGTPSTNNDGAANPGLPTDLQITKTATPVALAGGQITYTLTVTNNGPGNSSGYVVTDPLPAGVTGADTSTPGCSIADGVATCIGNALDDGNSVAMTVTADAPDPFPAEISNTATVTADEMDTNSSNNTSTATTDPTVVDLAVTKAAAPNPYVPGDQVTWTVTVTNGGPAAADGATVSDPLPTVLDGDGFTWTCVPGAGATCTPAGTEDITDTVDIPANGHVVYTVTGTVPPGLQTSLANTATVTPPSGTIDPGCDPTCDSSVTDNPDPTVSLVASKTSSPDPYVPGQSLTYTVTVTNGGPSDAIGATVSDPLPAALDGAGFTWTCAPSPGATCTPSGAGDVTDTVDIPASGQVVYTVTGTVPVGTTGELDNTATVTPPPGSTDPNCSPNCAAHNHDPLSSPSLSIQKIANASDGDTAAITVGETITYSYTVTNDGNVTVTHVSVSDPSLGAVTCPIATLAVGASETCTGDKTYVVTQADVDAGSVSDTATATGDPPVGSPVQSPPSTVTVPSEPKPAVSLVKTATVSPGVDQTAAKAGDTITYSFVVTNTGNVVLRSVAVSDPTGSAVSCPTPQAPGLAPGASETCTSESPYVVTIADQQAGKVSDTATATGTDTSGTVSAPSDPSTAVVMTAPVATVQALRTIGTGYGQWHSGGSNGTAMAAAGAVLAMLGAAGVLGLRRRRRATGQS